MNMIYRIKHVPTGRYFGYPTRSVSSSIDAIKNTYITVSLKELKLGTSSGRGKIWSVKRYAMDALRQLHEISNPKDWVLEEI